VDPVLFFFIRAGVHPNVLTFFALIFGVMVAPLLAFGFSKGALFSMLFSGYFDTLDGSLARAINKQSDFGAFFDIVSDRIVEFSIILGLFLVDPGIRALPCILMLGSVLICVTTFLCVGVFQENNSNKSFFYSPGIMERTEAFFLFAIIIIFPGSFFIIGVLFSFLVFLTGAIRAYEFYKS